MAAIFPSNWAAAPVLLGTARIPLFANGQGWAQLTLNAAISQRFWPKRYFLQPSARVGNATVTGREAQSQHSRSIAGFSSAHDGSTAPRLFIFRRAGIFTSLSIALVLVCFGFSYGR